jgi:predicted enzyme related to lactoylglutathione lyase
MRPDDFRAPTPAAKNQGGHMGRVVHFEIVTDDPDRVARFYESVFGWQVENPQGMEQYWLVTTGEQGTVGINGGIMGPHLPRGVVNTAEVDNLDEFVAKVKASGGTVELGPREIPGIGRHAYCKDIEGNLFGALQPAAPSR